MSRHLATIQKIRDIHPIPGADAIEVATINSWRVVVKKGEYNVGDLVIYFEVDSFIPTALAPFLTKGGAEPREYEGIKGERLRTVKLRGQISQGLVLPLSVLGSFGEIVEATDVTEILGILKYDPPIPAQLSGTVKGAWPSAVPKTDEERCQNLTNEWLDLSVLTYELTEKLEGCLFSETLISTMSGQKPVTEIKVGDSIMSFNHNTNKIDNDIVSGVLVRQETTEWIEIILEDGTELKVTPNHPVFLKDLNGYRRADELQIGDELQLTEKLNFRGAK